MEDFGRSGERSLLTQACEWWRWRVNPVGHVIPMPRLVTVWCAIPMPRLVTVTVCDDCESDGVGAKGHHNRSCGCFRCLPVACCWCWGFGSSTVASPFIIRSSKVGFQRSSAAATLPLGGLPVAKRFVAAAMCMGGVTCGIDGTCNSPYLLPWSAFCHDC